MSFSVSRKRAFRSLSAIGLSPNLKVKDVRQPDFLRKVPRAADASTSSLPISKCRDRWMGHTARFVQSVIEFRRKESAVMAVLARRDAVGPSINPHQLSCDNRSKA